MSTVKMVAYTLAPPRRSHDKPKGSARVETAHKKKEPHCRVVTETPRWKTWKARHTPDLHDTDSQRHFLSCMDSSYTLFDRETQTMVRSQLQSKLAGYKYQDQEKHLWCPDAFVALDDVVVLLRHCALQCFYCAHPTRLLYENARDPLQWTLERIDNCLGHVRGNVQIACLQCNLRRRTMFHERYLMTKRMVNVTKTGGDVGGEEVDGGEDAKSHTSN